MRGGALTPQPPINLLHVAKEPDLEGKDRERLLHVGGPSVGDSKYNAFAIPIKLANWPRGQCARLSRK